MSIIIVQRGASMVTIIHKRPHEMNANIFGTRKKAAH